MARRYEPLADGPDPDDLLRREPGEPTEPIVIETWVGQVGNSSYTIRYRILDEVGHVAAEAMTKLACLDLDTGRPIRMDAELRALLQRLLIPD